MRRCCRYENYASNSANCAAVRDVNFEMLGAETVGLVGESGAGKSTLARAILRLLQPARGSVEFSGLDLLKIPPAAMRAQRRYLQIIFQDPLASLNPRMTVGDAIAEPLLIFEPELRAARTAAKSRRDVGTGGAGSRHGAPLPA